ncbi:UBX domain-containing protein [Cardiosporidium cionae]|uniref:UBX domain-containing protein n=1 Tax=Cardiosporidium cionae TaxID=476202 RepID=A0ABQ7JA10_9APIC|nr:UBX domain-containing protein [Cardiosporidium cionae]|eukprot:KAF8820843.1 UBX domain-containing protein [Cardiosporidium cionae]
MSNIRSLDDFDKNASSDDPSITSNYTGGEHSGLAVENPADRLSDWSNRVQEPAPEGSKKVTVYKNGFKIDDGPFRSIEDPENEKFLKEMRSGSVTIAPKELQSDGKPVYIQLEDRRTELYANGESSSTALFGGTGRSMRENSASMISSSAALSVDSGRSSLIIDETKGTTTLQIRFHNGERKKQRFNLDQTVADLHSYIMEVAPVDGEYRLMEGFPPKEITSNTSLTLARAGLIQATVTQVLR